LATDEEIKQGLDATLMRESFDPELQVDFDDHGWTPFPDKGAISLPN
jgi:hypothetical protein